MTVKNINEYFDKIFPSELSEKWDNDGIMVCQDENKEITGILLTLDLTDEAIQRAILSNCNLIITHHPLIFKPLSRIDDSLISKRVCKLIKEDISLLSYHTRFDSAVDGINAELAGLFALKNIVSFGADSNAIGRIGDIEELSSNELARLARDIFESPVILYEGEKRIKRVALVSGGGWDFVDEAIALGADAFITGEIRYNKALDYTAMGYTFIDAGHYPTEILCDRILKKHLIKCGVSEDKIITFRYKNPSKIII